LISFGLAGGLDPALSPGAVIVPSAVVTCGKRYTADANLSHMLGGATEHVVLGADGIVASVEEKRRLYNETGAAAVDIESGAVARTAAEHDIPFAVLRAVCDPADRSLPPAALTAIDARGGINVWRLLGSVGTHPTQLPALLALAAAAVAAKRALAERINLVVTGRYWPSL